MIDVPTTGQPSVAAASIAPGTEAGLPGAAPTPSTGAPIAGTEGKLAAVEALRETRSAPRAQAAQQGFRTLNPQAVKMAEMARDSVFRQIAFRLNRDGGEMRVRLDPPELGELDMRLVVEKGGALRLSIAAERPEMAFMLDKHLLELQRALQESGLQVVHAEVHARDGGGAGSAFGEQTWGGGDGEPDDGAPIAQPGLHARRGYIHAEGLDFWV